MDLMSSCITRIFSEMRTSLVVSNRVANLFSIGFWENLEKHEIIVEKGLLYYQMPKRT